MNPYVSERVFSILNVLNINNFLNSHYGSHYITGVKIFFENPFFGVGYDNYQFVCSDPLYENNYLYNGQRCSSHLHNLYLQILADFGILIFIIFLLFITYPVYLVVRLFLQYGYFDIKLYKYISYILVLIFPIKTSGDLFSTWYGGVFWFNFAICARMILQAYRNKY